MAPVRLQSDNPAFCACKHQNLARGSTVLRQSLVSQYLYMCVQVQCSWIGFPASTGAPFVDHLIADLVVAPPELVSPQVRHSRSCTSMTRAVFSAFVYCVTSPRGAQGVWTASLLSSCIAVLFVLVLFGLRSYSIEVILRNAWTCADTAANNNNIDTTTAVFRDYAVHALFLHCCWLCGSSRGGCHSEKIRARTSRNGLCDVQFQQVCIFNRMISILYACGDLLLDLSLRRCVWNESE